MGFANIAIATIATVSIFSVTWIMPSAIAGWVFYGCAGVSHLARGKRNALENTALVSDLFLFAVLSVYIIVEGVSLSR